MLLSTLLQTTLLTVAQFFKVDMSDEGVKVRLKKGGWVLSQED
jgi:hypothetical protein